MKLNIKEIAIFGMLGALMFAQKKFLEFAPNIHLVGVLLIAITVVYRKKALYPLYIFVFLDGIFGGFSTWWIPNLYVWTILWGVTMILPEFKSIKTQRAVYMIICSLHGFLFGTLYAPVQALFFNLDFKGTLAWIAAGIPYDIIHGISNFLCGILILPIITLLKHINKYVKN